MPVERIMAKEWKENSTRALLWGLCVVNSRVTGANTLPGDDSGSGLRLVPLADLASHRLVSGGHFELSGEESIANGCFMDAAPLADAGTFVVRLIWKCGSRREPSLGDEICFFCDSN